MREFYYRICRISQNGCILHWQLHLLLNLLVKCDLGLMLKFYGNSETLLRRDG